MFLLHIFVKVILPVFIVLGLGYIFGRTNKPDIRSFTRLVWLVTGPCLAFAALVTSTIPDDDFARIFFFVILSTLLTWPVAILAARGLHLDRQTSSVLPAVRALRQCRQLWLPRLAVRLWTRRR